MACHGLTAEVQEVIEKDGNMQDILKYLDQEENKDLLEVEKLLKEGIRDVPSIGEADFIDAHKKS